MNNLTTRKIVLGMLLVLVLTFSVQGIADAADLPLSKTSGDLQTKSEGETFEISFSVGIRSNTTAIRNSDRELIDDGTSGLTTPNTATPSTTPPGTRIDSSGYLIAEIDGKDYRLTTPINADPSGLGEIPPSPTGYGRFYKVHKKRPSPFSDYLEYSGVIFANSSRSAFSEEGYPLYYHIPALNLNPGDDEGQDNDTSDTGERARTTSQIKIQTDDFYTRRALANRYHYNEESVVITFTKNGVVVDNAVTFKLDATTFQRDITDITEVPGSAPNALPRSVTLICTPEGDDTTGTYKVRITDMTPVTDTPWTAIPGGTRAFIEFTLYVVKETPATNYGVFAVLDDGATTTRRLRVDTAKEIERVSSRFNVVDTGDDEIQTDTNLEIRYKVVKGSGTLYAAVAPTETPYVGPNQDLTAHQDSNVFLNTNGTDNEVSASIAGQDRQTFGATIVYEYSGSTPATTPAPTPAPAPAPPPDPVTIIREVSPPEPRLIIEPSTLTGGPGSTYKLTIRAVDASGTAVSVPRVAVSNLAFIQAGGQVSPVTITAPITANVTLPSTPGQYKLSAAATGYQDATVDITVAAGTLSVLIDPVGGAPGTRSTVTVTATNAGGRTRNVSVTLGITTGGGTLSPSLVTTNTNGTAISILTRGRALGDNYFVTATADGYTQRSVLAAGERVVISETQPSATGSTPPAQTGASGVAADLDAYDGNQQVGSLNSPLSEPLVVEVVDANDNPIENVRVRFTTTIGSGRFSPRTPRTDEDGFAETTFTPTSTGRIRISATVAGVDDRAAFTVQGGEPADALEKVSGDNQSGTPGNALAAPFVVEVQDEDGEPLTGHSVTFSVTAGGGSLSATSATTNANGRAQTTLTLGSAPGINSVQASVSGVDSVTFSTSIDAKILVTAANRPMMYWIAGGGLYSLSGAKEAKIAESANGVAVGGGKIYWTSQVNASSGAINSANLDGTGATTLTTILAVPMGIAVDTAGSKLYWTNSRGRIQSANLNGSSIKNVMQNLTDPTDIVVSNGFIYWTEGGNSVRRVNISGQKIAIDVAVNLDSVGGLAVGGGKVYWTEMTSASAGTVNGADLNGTNFAALATLLSAPMGISVDTAGSKLYWTNARGRVQSANLDGSGIKNVVEGLISPSKLAIGGANTETTTTAKKATTPAKKDNAKYDVNGDGTVDNTDASLVSAGFDTGNAKYDVNGDGKVSFLDLLLVFDNRDDDAAAAPAIVGMKLNAVQIDRIEEQIDLLIATNDRSPAAMRTLVYMQQLLATARPEKTQLFANYPNPFNPETWLPYELATDTHVKITIYNTQGVVIRTLQFGHQSAGYYTERDRAAYWDGRNALGEQVASGLYFYQLETDEMSSMRKMVILK